MIEEKLALLKKGMTDFAQHSLEMLEKSLKGLSKKDATLLSEVIKKDEKESNDYDMEFDKLCIICLARYQPVTKNLRTVVSVIKINGDLERISDHCVNIAQSAEFLIANPTGKSYEFLAEMAQKVMDMTQLTIKAFITEDCYLANKVMRGDDEIDKLQDQAIAKGIELMQKQNQLIPSVLRLINIAKNLERIADLNTNICEEIIYFSGGTVTKHHTIS